MSDELTAYQLLKEGRYLKAKEILEKLVEENPAEHNLFNFALCLWRLGELDEALSVLERLLEANPEHKKGLFLKGVILRREGRFEEAREVFTKLGEDYLAQAIPSLVEKPEVDEPLEFEVVKEDETEELPAAEEAVTADSRFTSSYKGDIVRIKIDGSFEVEKGHFVAFLFKEGSLSEFNGTISGSGKGELVISGFSLPEGDITQDRGEGQLLIDLEEETYAIKSNKDEQVFFQASPIIHWKKL
ncbi:MAG: tetratricopeptide repeat protein [Deferribacteres bacterium]|nr:tetratricopeptide repeat protein [Deferribacteres bacterium]